MEWDKMNTFLYAQRAIRKLHNSHLKLAHNTSELKKMHLTEEDINAINLDLKANDNDPHKLYNNYLRQINFIISLVELVLKDPTENKPVDLRSLHNLELRLEEIRKRYT